MKRTHALLLATATSMGALVAINPAPAQAGETRWLTTGGKGGAGYVRAQVTVEWVGKRTYDIEGWVEDMCEGDGRYAQVYYDNGRGASDKDGCGNGRRYFDPAPVTVDYKIGGLQVGVFEMQGTTTYYADQYVFDNWRN